MDHKQLSDALGAIYELPFDTSKWPDVQQLLTNYSNTVASHVLIFENHSGNGLTVADSNIYSHLGQEVAAKAADAYSSFYYQFDTGKALEYSLKMPGEVITNDAITSDFDKRNCPLYNEFNKEFNCERQLILGSAIGNKFANIIATRPSGDGDFNDEDKMAFGILSENILKSIQHSNRMQSLFGHDFVVDSVYQDKTNATIVVDEKLNVIWQNESAGELLKQAGNIGYRHGRLSIDPSPLREQIKALVKRAIYDGEVSRENCGLSKVTQDDRPYALTVFSSNKRTLFATDSSRVATLVIRTPRQFSEHDIEKLKLVYDLTPGEARLALAIASGMTLQDYADANGTSVQTHRKSIQTIMSKTGTNTQHWLTALIYNLI